MDVDMSPYNKKNITSGPMYMYVNSTGGAFTKSSTYCGVASYSCSPRVRNGCVQVLKTIIMQSPLWHDCR